MNFPVNFLSREAYIKVCIVISFGRCDSTLGFLLPKNRTARYRKTRSYAVLSDLLRYEILGADLGLYADCDVCSVRGVTLLHIADCWEQLAAEIEPVAQQPTGTVVSLQEWSHLRSRRQPKQHNETEPPATD